VRAARGLAGRLFALERGTAAYGAIYRALGATPSAPARLAEGA